MGARTLDKLGMAHVFPAQYGFWDGQYCWRVKKARLQLYYVFNPTWGGRSIENIQPVEEKQGPYFKWKMGCRTRNFPEFNAMKRKPAYVPNTLWIDDEQSPPNRQWIWMGDHDDADVRQVEGERWPFVKGVFDRVENRR